MKQKSFDAVRQKSRVLAVLLCLAVLLLTGCGGGGAAAPEPPASAPAAGRTDGGYGFFSGGTRAFGTGIGVQFDGRV